ncbi:hypothetical protein JTE90_023135 [Oedothorax gibbosus]|uniref:Uncharacterized protein n=1 Tax=Oedothorax gibbosus TaxID=931172 RepID=A0AAV6UQE9_9ARAC|nr:hypothetical protein JTE90_023135 [Oedothorax gibbosus]
MKLPCETRGVHQDRQDSRETEDGECFSIWRRFLWINPASSVCAESDECGGLVKGVLADHLSALGWINMAVEMHDGEDHDLDGWSTPTPRSSGLDWWIWCRLSHEGSAHTPGVLRGLTVFALRPDSGTGH